LGGVFRLITPLLLNRSSRSAKMFVAIPSFERISSPCVRFPFRAISRRISSVHLSPSISIAPPTGQFVNGSCNSLSVIGIFTLASIACAISPTGEWLIAARVVQGVGAALVMPTALALLSAAFPPEKRAKGLGLFGSITGLAVLGGPVIGGAITEGAAWQWIFWLNLPIGLLLLVLAKRYIEESKGHDARFDIAGVSLIALSMLGLVWGLVKSSDSSVLSLQVGGSILAGLVFLGFYIQRQRTTEYPLTPLSLFRSRVFTFGNIATFFLYGSLYSAVFFVAQYLQTSQGASPLTAGLQLIPWTIALFFVAPLAGSLVPKIGERMLVSIGLLLQAIGMFSLAVIAENNLPYPMMIIPLVIAGIGVSAVMPATQHAVMSSVEHHYIGKASGIFNTLRYLGGTFGVATLGVIFAIHGGYESAADFSQGFAMAMVTCGILSVIGAGAGLYLKGRSAATR
jgi:EmrB/QacA subfamily drug resistance transporter